MRRAAFSVCLGLAALAAAGERWPQFRGPGGAATDLDCDLPAEWNDSAIRWKAPLPGPGNSSAIVWDGAVFATAASPDGTKRWTLRFDAETGKEIWRKELPFSTVPKHARNTHATATPTADGERVYCLFGGAGGKLLAVAYAFDGTEAWRREIGAFEGKHSSGASPIAHAGMVLVPFDHDGPSALVCLDGKTGQEKWRAPRPAKLAAYSTPLIAGKHVVVSSTSAVAAYDLDTGKPAWEQPLFARRVVGSPLLAGGRIYAASGEGNKGDKAALLDPAAGGKSAVDLTVGLPYCTTPLAGPGRLLLVGDIGIARMLDDATGKTVWEQRLGGTFFSSPVRAAERVFAISESGDVHAFQWHDAYQPLGTSRLDDTFRSTPALAGNRAFLRGEAFLWCVGR